MHVGEKAVHSFECRIRLRSSRHLSAQHHFWPDRKTCEERVGAKAQRGTLSTNCFLPSQLQFPLFVRFLSRTFHSKKKKKKKKNVNNIWPRHSSILVNLIALPFDFFFFFFLTGKWMWSPSPMNRGVVFVVTSAIYCSGNNRQ